MHYVKVTRPRYEQSQRYRGKVGEVVGHWGPDNSQNGREGFLVEFGDGEVIGVAEEEVEESAAPGTQDSPASEQPPRGPQSS